jgi:phosphatidylserine/phosphatidylglycerophosphate/cardiolipin synthase-like enzyme
MKTYLLILVLLTACTITANVVKEYGPAPEVYFCPKDNCRGIFSAYLQQATDIRCALYDTDVPEIITILGNKHAKLVLDDRSSNLSQLKGVIDSKYTQMHNKFCILDNQTVITGSMNPTFRDTSLNNNNLLIIHSKKIAETYNTEFDELFSGTFSGGKATMQSRYYLNNDNIDVYFCPEDWCANKVLYALDTAQQSIDFMTFSFTHDKIGDLLIKKHKQGVVVRGVMERTQNSQYSELRRLNESGIAVRWDTNKGNMHHKVFIIDNSIVVTGSFNPSVNGDTKNDENMLIIESKELAQKYAAEFESLFIP